MRQFSLIDEPWIPVRELSGELRHFGIRDVLIHARGIRAIEHESPLVVGALYRLLLAILYRALEGPADIEVSRKLFQSGFPEKSVASYLDKWSERFFLFDDRYPFLQIPSFFPQQMRAWTVIAAEHNADNAKVLFDHVSIQSAGSIPSHVAAQWLLATQSFALSAGKSELFHTSTGPSATSAMVFPWGKNLLDTLIFCLVPQSREVLANDIPTWEKEPESTDELKEGPEKLVAGYASLYSWRNRSIRLQLDSDGRVSQVALASGVKGRLEELRDPMVGYLRHPEKGLLPLQFRERGLWRDFDSLLPEPGQLAPLVIENTISLSRIEKERLPSAVMALGQLNDNAKIEFWRMEMFALPRALVEQRTVRSEVHGFLARAEDVQKELWSASRLVAENLLTRGERKPVAADVKKFVAQMPGISVYWASLEAAFHHLLELYLKDSSLDLLETFWNRSLLDSLNLAWDRNRKTALGSDVWTIRAFVKADFVIQRQKTELKTLIKQLSESERKVE